MQNSLVTLSAAGAAAPTGRVVGVDITPAMLEQAQSKAQAQGLSSMVTFVLGDIEQLQDALSAELQGWFDVITCSAATPFPTQPQQALASWRQWLKPGGSLVFNAFVPPAVRGYELFGQVAQQYDFQERDPSAVLGSVELETAGWKDVQVLPELKQRWVPAESAAAYAERVWEGALTRHPFRGPEDLPAHFGDEGLSQFHDEFVSAVAASVEATGGFDACKKGVLSTPMILHVTAAS